MGGKYGVVESVDVGRRRRRKSLTFEQRISGFGM